MGKQQNVGKIFGIPIYEDTDLPLVHPVTGDKTHMRVDGDILLVSPERLGELQQNAVTAM